MTHAIDDGPRNALVASGLLPGERQSVFRAELYAVNAAISVAERMRIFCDNAAVVKDVVKIVSHGYSHSHWINHPDRDVLQTTAKLLATKGVGCVRISWVKAHRSVESAVTTKDLWRIHHNSKADDAAKSALKLQSDALRSTGNYSESAQR